MTGSPLPPELLSLVHHVELKKSGWWDKALQQIIVAAMWLHEDALTRQGIVDAVSDTFSTKIVFEKVNAQIDALLDSGTLVVQTDGDLKLSIASLKDYVTALAEAEQNEKVAKDFFLKLVEEACPDVSPEECWRLFNRDCLAPLVQQLGARTYEVVSGTRQNVESNITSPLFFEHYESDLRQRLRTAVVNFFDPKNPAVRAYVLSYMNAGFFLEATALTGEALERLAARRETPPQFFVFLDTNCLFSVLDLHDNPSNEAVVSLVDLMQRISPRVPSTLYVSLQTIEEAKRVLYGRKEGLKGVPPVLNVSKAVVQTGMAEGVTLRYFRACEEAKAPLDFNPYLTNFNSIIREKRIELYSTCTSTPTSQTSIPSSGRNG